MVFFFGRQVQNPIRQMRFLLSFSDVLYFNIGSMLSPSQRPWASASHYSVSVYCSINSFPHLFSGEAEQCSGRDMLIMWNVACWFKFSSLVQRHFDCCFFSLGHSGLASTCLIKDVKFSDVLDLAVFIYMCALGCI